MPARKKFSREQLQVVALRIVDAQGLAAMSMRALANAVGTGPMTIYNYVRDREELDGLLVDAVMAEACLPMSEHEDWRVDVRAILESMWKALRTHPNAIPLVLMRRTGHKATLEIAEALLSALARSGCSAAQLLAAFRTLNGFVMGLAQAQLTTSKETSDGGRDSHVIEAGSLPEDQFPRLRQIASVAAGTDSNQEFRAGVDMILGGLSSESLSGSVSG